MVLYGSNFGDANAHTCFNMPTLFAGGGFKHGQHLAFEQNEQLSSAESFRLDAAAHGHRQRPLRVLDRNDEGVGEGMNRFCSDSIRLFRAGLRVTASASAFTLGSQLGASVSAPPPATAAFIEKYCASCHDDVEKAAGLDLASLKYAPGNPANFVQWVKVHDRLQAGEMPPKEKKRPDASELAASSSPSPLRSPPRTRNRRARRPRHSAAAQWIRI